MRKQFVREQGSILIVAMMTITILTMICATSLYIASQNSGTGMQTSGWQQALSAAEAGVDTAMRALNANVSSSPAPWAGWRQGTYSDSTTFLLPTIEPSPTPSATAAGTPSATSYFLLPS